MLSYLILLALTRVSVVCTAVGAPISDGRIWDFGTIYLQTREHPKLLDYL